MFGYFFFKHLVTLYISNLIIYFVSFHLHSLNFELHVILSGGLSVLPLLPAVAVTTVADLLPRVQEHGATLGSGTGDEIVISL